ncbi:MAG: hypothetical protein EPO65_08350 [Dehalococcoidia bacterium]|nr:MAG: hypothetical protein EPO65_08350 [Dehalococcoidia bacterium]
MARRTARTAAWAVLMGLVAARFADGLVPLPVEVLIGVGATVATDWFLRWREGGRERDEASAAERAAQERDERLGRER